MKKCFSRLLIPFHLDAPITPDEWFESAFENHTESGWLGAEADKSSYCAFHSSYVLDYHEHVRKFLFDGHGRTGCRFLVNNDPLIASDNSFEVWLGTQKTELVEKARCDRPSKRGLEYLNCDHWHSRQPFESPKCRLDLNVVFCKDPIELWFSGLGIGVLSVAFEIRKGNQEIVESDVLELHHALATAQKSVWFRDIGQHEQAFDFHKFISKQLRQFRSQQFAMEVACRGRIFSTLEFEKNESNNIHSPSIQQILSHISQVHPSSHPGEHKTSMFSDLLAINQEHACRVSANGVAHVAIVDNESEYSRKRNQNIQRGYFLGYLLAMIQESALAQILNRSTRQLGSSPLESVASDVFEDVVHFDMEGEFAKVSSRGPIQKHHELAQDNVNLHACFTSTQRAINNFQKAVENERESKSEHAMHGLHIFIVSVYSLELAHVLANAFHLHHGMFLGASLIVVVLTTLALAVHFVFAMAKSKTPFKKRLVALLLSIAFVHAMFLTANAINTQHQTGHMKIEKSDNH